MRDGRLAIEPRGSAAFGLASSAVARGVEFLRELLQHARRLLAAGRAEIEALLLAREQRLA